jgi:hypothetical protein
MKTTWENSVGYKIQLSFAVIDFPYVLAYRDMWDEEQA